MMLQRQHAKNPATGELVCTHVRVIHTGIGDQSSVIDLRVHGAQHTLKEATRG